MKLASSQLVTCFFFERAESSLAPGVELTPPAPSAACCWAAVAGLCWRCSWSCRTWLLQSRPRSPGGNTSSAAGRWGRQVPEPRARPTPWNHGRYPLSCALITKLGGLSSFVQWKYPGFWPRVHETVCVIWCEMPCFFRMSAEFSNNKLSSFTI